MKYAQRAGHLILNGVTPAPHELSTLVVLTSHGFDVSLIPPSLTPNSKTPDLEMLGKLWEMKSPIGSNKRTLEHIVKKPRINPKTSS